MVVLRDTDRQKGIPFCLSDVSVELMAQKMAHCPNSCNQQWEETPENHATKAPGDLGKERQILGNNRVTQCLAILWKWKALLGWLRGNTYAPVNQSRPKGKEVKVTGKKTEESAFTILLEKW